MVDLNAISPATTALNAVAPPSSAVTAVITQLSAAIQDIARSIQTNAVPASLSPGGDLTLTTSLGSLTLSLQTQQMSQQEKQALTQTLMDLIQTQKPLTLTIQPGANGQPPSQAVLLVPLPPPAAPQALPPAVQTPMPPVNLPPVTAGQVFPAEVLPNLPAAPLPQMPVAQMPVGQMPVAPAVIPSGTVVQTPTSAPPQTVSVPAQTQAGSVPSAAAAPVALPAAPVPVSVQTSPAAPVSAAAPIAPAPLANAVPPSITTGPPAPPLAVAPPVVATPLAAMPQTQIPAAAAPSALVQPGANVTVTIDAVLPPASAEATARQTPPLAPNQMVATVINQGSDGNLILKAGDAVLFVRTQATAPPGTQFVISLSPAKSSAVILPPLPDSGNFPDLPQAVAVLAQAAPQVMQQVLTNHIPTPSEAMPGALLFLFSAFKQGNLRGWLGNDAVDTLMRMSKDDIVASLTRDLSQAGGPAQDNVVGEWHAYPIPLYAQQQFQAMTLYVHHDRDGRDGKASGGDAGQKVRFLIDMKMSRLGAMQLDGFVQPKKMDMILRSETGLPPGFHSELRSAYLRAMGAVGYAGSLNFQVGRRFWIQMQPPRAHGIVT